MKRTTTGSTLLAVIFIMVIVASLAGIVLTITTNVSRLSKRTNERAQAIAYGDAVLESLFDQWRQAMISATADTDRKQGLSNSSLTGFTAPSTGVLTPPPNISLASYSVVAATPLLVPLPGSADRPLPENGTRSSLRARLHYLATATVNFPGPTALNGAVTIQRDFVRAGKNIFDNFYFGTQKATEMHPGAPMYISGTCYIGGDLYTAHDYLHYLKDVTYTGTHTIDYRPEDSRKGTAPTILNGGLGDNWDLNNQPHVGSEQKLFDVKLTDLDPRFVDDPRANDLNSTTGPNTSYNSVNDDGFHEIIEKYESPGADPLQLDNPTNPDAGSPSNSERLVSQADYRIEVDIDNKLSIFKGASTTALASGADFTAIKNAITMNTAIYDKREGDNVRVITLDVGAIATAYSASKILDNVGASDGLTFYIQDTSAKRDSTGAPILQTPQHPTLPGALPDGTVTSTSARGVKLINGATLPYNATNKTGFTVVSPNSVYIQGDYNTGTTATLKPASNTATSYTPPNDTPSPVVSGYNRAPAAVVGDAVKILSNAWTDAKSTSTGPNGSGPTASNTTVNCAIVAGNVPTVSGEYSGGIENFARFLEDWSGGKYFTVYGSLALLYNSAWSTQPWSLARYSPPNRRWYYDPLLQDTNPPGFRIARSYERGRRIIR
jgi:type II secretory pathway pseudopilin PulG